MNRLVCCVLCLSSRLRALLMRFSIQVNNTFRRKALIDVRFTQIAPKSFGKVTRHKQVGCRFAQLFPVIIGCVVGRYVTLVVELLIPEDPWDFKFLNTLKHI